MHLAARTAGLIHSPIGAAHGLLPLRTNERPLLDLSQAAPSFPPAPVVVGAIGSAAGRPEVSRYAPQRGLPELRDAFAADMSADYGAPISPDDVLITAGCNQAFCIVASALADPGDSVVVVSPFYFNHDMWLRVEGVEGRYLPAEDDGVPDPARLAPLVDERTRAVVLVSPGNPTGVTIPPAVIRGFARECRRLGLVLIVDETYRTYRGFEEPAHDLFAEPDWADHVASLHSFSKDLAIPGYRVGAVVGGPALLTQALKLLDCVAISAPRIGQEAAIAGLQDARAWRDAQVRRIAELQASFEEVMAAKPGGFELVSAGAYFGWVRHPFGNGATDDVVRRLVLDHDVLVIPGTAFTPDDQQMVRVSFANLDAEDVEELPRRLDEMT